MLAVLNTLIICKFLRLTSKRRKFHARADKLLENSQRNKNYQEERRLVVLLTSIMHLFFLTMTPSAFLSLLYSEQRERQLGFQVNQLMHILLYSEQQYFNLIRYNNF